MTIESPTTLPAYARRLRTLNEIVLPIVPTRTTSSAHADSNQILSFYAIASIIFEAATSAAFSWTSKDNYRASRLTAIGMQANVTKAARVPARFS